LVFLRQVAKKAENLSDQYKKLIEEKKGFYNQLEDRLFRLKHLRNKVENEHKL
jgi:hypothetical protein